MKTYTILMEYHGHFRSWAVDAENWTEGLRKIKPLFQAWGKLLDSTKPRKCKYMWTPRAHKVWIDLDKPPIFKADPFNYEGG